MLHIGVPLGRDTCWNFGQAEDSLGDSPSGLCDYQHFFASIFKDFSLLFGL